MLAVVGCLMLTLGCTSAEKAPLNEDVVISTGNPGGIWNTYGAVLADRLDARHDRRVTALRSDGAVENVHRLASGDAHLAFALADVSAAAVTGQEPFDKRLDLCAVARLYDNYVQLVVLKSSRATAVAQLRGAVVAVGSPGSGTAFVANRLLRYGGLTPGRDVTVVHLDVAEASAALGDGRVQAMFWSGGLPTAPIARLARDRGVALVSLQPAAQRMVDVHGNVYRPSTIPTSAYGAARPVPTVSVPNYLLAPCRVSEAVVTAALDVLFDPGGGVRDAHPEAARLNKRTAIATGSVPLHPAAVRWFRGHGQ